MSLSPEVIASLRTSAGLSATPPAPTQTGSNNILAQRKAALGMDKSVEETTKDSSNGNFVKSMSDEFGGGKNSVGQKLIDQNKQAVDELNGPMGAKQFLAPTKAVFRGVGDIAGAVAHPIGAAIDALTGGKASEIFKSIANTSPSKGSVMDKVTDLPIVQEIAKHVSNEDFGRLVNILSLGLGNEEKINTGTAENPVMERPSVNTLIDRTKPQIESIKNAPQTIIDKTSEVGTKVSDVAGKVKEGVMGKVKGVELNDLQKINEKITPKPTVKQARLATEEGRLYKGEPKTTFKSKTLDKVATPEQQANSTRTVQRLIPDAANMDEPTLYGAMKEKIGEISKELKPEMQKVPIKPETVSKMQDTWEEIKTKQNSDPYTSGDVNTKRLQADFEERLKAIDGGTMDDVWEARKAYDNSVPDRIKQADNMSSESLQTQHDMWMENRKIFSDTINDMQDGLGATSKSAFSDMRDLYEGQRGIMSKAKIDTVPEDSTVIKATKGLIKKAIPYGIGSHL